MPVEKDFNPEKLANLTEGYSGAEICLICREAGMNALRRNIESTEVLNKDFLEALNKVKPRITQEMINNYPEF